MSCPDIRPNSVISSGGFRNSRKEKEMKRNTGLFLMLLAIVFFAAFRTDAQKPQRIQFEKGKSSAMVKGSTGQYGTTYVVRARSGQMLQLDLSPTAKVGIKVETNGTYGEMVLLREERGGHYEVGLEESGDYTIFVGSTGNKPVTFTLTVRITRLTDI